MTQAKTHFRLSTFVTISRSSSRSGSSHRLSPNNQDPASLLMRICFSDSLGDHRIQQNRNQQPQKYRLANEIRAYCCTPSIQSALVVCLLGNIFDPYSNLLETLLFQVLIQFPFGNALSETQNIRIPVNNTFRID